MKPRNAVMCNLSLLKMVKFIKMVVSRPQQLCPMSVCMFTQVSCECYTLCVAAQFLTPPALPHLVPLQLCTAAVPRGPVWGQHWALGGAGTQQDWHRIRRSGGVSIWFFIKTALVVSAVFFE